MSKNKESGPPTNGSEGQRAVEAQQQAYRAIGVNTPGDTSTNVHCDHDCCLCCGRRNCVLHGYDETIETCFAENGGSHVVECACCGEEIP